MTFIPYRRIRKLSTAIAKHKRDDDKRDDKTFHADALMREYEQVFEQYNGYALNLIYTNGWVRQAGHDGHKPKLLPWGPARLSDLPKRTAELYARLHAQEIDDGSAPQAE